MRTVARLVLAVVLQAAWPSAGAHAAKAPSRPSIDGLEATRDGARLVVSFHVTGALTDEILERIHSGIPVTFDHDVQVVARRAGPLWTSRVLAREQVQVQVAYDPLTRRYDLLRRLERRSGGRLEPPPAERRGTVASIAEVEAWMTAVLTEWPVAIFDLARVDRLRLRAESALGRKYVLLLFPGRVTVQAECGIGP